ncbi:MAG: methylaspartate ammonia-lyase [Pseudomonadota bacterium]
MEIVAARFVPGSAAYYFDDQAAIRDDAVEDGFLYRGTPKTHGFSSIRQPGETVSIMLQLADGRWAIGDCCAVQYAGAGGRDPLFNANEQIAVLENTLAPVVVGTDAADIESTMQIVEAIRIADQPLHTAVRYGISQALLQAAATNAQTTLTEVVCRLYDLPLPDSPIPIFAQSGDDRYRGADKMLLRRVDALPHGLINTVSDKLGAKGEKLLQYVDWLRQRIDSLDSDYRPVLHIDVYGTIGLAFNNDPATITAYLNMLGDAAGPYELYIEGPVDAGNRDAQIDLLGELRHRIDTSGTRVKIVADEWCNSLADIQMFAAAGCCHMVQVKTPDLGSVLDSVAAVRLCREYGVEAYQGGTCNETDLSARCCTQIALASRPERLLAKPGMGVDEAVQIVRNEMHRTLAQIDARLNR